MQPAEAKLVERSLTGDLAAFNQIVDLYQTQVYNLAARVLGDRTTTEDITQEAFISAFRSLKGFRGGNLRAWLLRIARNLCYDYLRSSKRKPVSSLDEALEAPGFVPPTSSDPSPESQALTGELGAAINGAIQTLPPDQRIALVMIDVQGYSYEDAAHSADVSVGTIKSRLSRARAKVREGLSAHRELLPDQFRQI
jgi:RNA polymerase sigma-70 factor (ECF subfamily)